MKTSESIKEIVSALLEAQKSFDTVKKDSNNPFFKSKYADLTSVINEVKDKLNNVGIVFIQGVDMVEQGPVVETMLLHTSGEFISSRTPVFCKKPDDPQALGSGITYSKRYALQAILGLPTADDDGESAMNRDSGSQSTTKPKKDTLAVSLKKINCPYGAKKVLEWFNGELSKKEQPPVASEGKLTDVQRGWILGHINLAIDYIGTQNEGNKTF
jgi:hypothetical protein